MLVWLVGFSCSQRCFSSLHLYSILLDGEIGAVCFYPHSGVIWDYSLLVAYMTTWNGQMGRFMIFAVVFLWSFLGGFTRLIPTSNRNPPTRQSSFGWTFFWAVSSCLCLFETGVWLRSCFFVSIRGWGLDPGRCQSVVHRLDGTASLLS